MPVSRKGSSPSSYEKGGGWGGVSHPEKLLHLQMMRSKQESTCTAATQLLPVFFFLFIFLAVGVGGLLLLNASVCALAKSIIGCSVSHSQPPFVL